MLRWPRRPVTGVNDAGSRTRSWRGMAHDLWQLCCHTSTVFFFAVKLTATLSSITGWKNVADIAVSREVTKWKSFQPAFRWRSWHICENSRETTVAFPCLLEISEVQISSNSSTLENIPSSLSTSPEDPPTWPGSSITSLSCLCCRRRLGCLCLW